MTKSIISLGTAACLLALPLVAIAETISSTSGNLSVVVNADGSYLVSAKDLNWQLGGNLPGPAQNVVSGKGKDVLGDYQQIAFVYTDAGQAMTGSIRLYDDKGLVLFSQTLTQASPTPPGPFPNFTTLPQDHFSFSYSDGPFAPPRFSVGDVDGPWSFFDRQDHALVISPASHFIVANMVGDGKKQMGSGFNSKLANLPAGFTQQTLLAMGQGINHTWDIWGQALTDLQAKKRPANDADIVLKYYGYWTDNGGAYWYNYDPEKGYQGTLQALVEAYGAAQIPIRYMQLDSWWYHKTLTQYDGKHEGPKNAKLPQGDWNRYGGTMDYTANTFIFPDGMEAFHEKTGLPFITHNRWIDPASPYHQKYKISGIAAVDPAFWEEIAIYLKSNGVFCYEQDWLNEILAYSPELSSTVDQGDAFFDSMANVCKAQGLSVQYCMATPRAFMQGSKYDNLTSIRVSLDGFTPDKYHAFLYTSRLAASLGIWPWTDVFKSTDMTNVLLSTLSAGPFGTGDAIGKENKGNILQAVRSDGVIVKPDAPLLPVDAAFLAEAQRQDVPLVASTYTDHDGIRTIYGIALKLPKSKGDSVSLTSDAIGCTGPVYFYDYFGGTGQKLDKGGALPIVTQGKECAFFVAAPIGATGIAFLGDPEKLVGTGKKRISSMVDDGVKLTTEVVLAANEPEVKLRGYAASSPDITVSGGQMDPASYDASTGLFTVTVRPDPNAPPQTVDGDPVRKMTVTMTPKKTPAMP